MKKQMIQTLAGLFCGIAFLAAPSANAQGTAQIDTLWQPTQAHIQRVTVGDKHTATAAVQTLFKNMFCATDSRGHYLFTRFQNQNLYLTMDVPPTQMKNIGHDTVSWWGQMKSGPLQGAQLQGQFKQKGHGWIDGWLKMKYLVGHPVEVTVEFQMKQIYQRPNAQPDPQPETCAPADGDLIPIPTADGQGANNSPVETLWTPSAPQMTRLDEGARADAQNAVVTLFQEMLCATDNRGHYIIGQKQGQHLQKVMDVPKSQMKQVGQNTIHWWGQVQSGPLQGAQVGGLFTQTGPGQISAQMRIKQTGQKPVDTTVAFQMQMIYQRPSGSIYGGTTCEPATPNTGELIPIPLP